MGKVARREDLLCLTQTQASALSTRQVGATRAAGHDATV